MKRESIIQKKMKHGLINKKCILLGLLVLSFLTLTGGLFYTPELINANKPFIELSGSIGTSIGNAETAYKYYHPTPKPAPVQTPTQIIISSHTITIRDTDIFIDDAKCDSIKNFETEICKKDYAELQLTLVDDYAESMTYKQVLKILNDEGLTFKEESND